MKVRNQVIKSSIDELSIEQFQKVASLTNDTGLDYLDKQMQIFEFLGVDPGVWEDMEVDEFKEIVTAFNKPYGKDIDFQPTIDLDGTIYRAFDDEFKLSIKDMKFIEKAIKSDVGNWIVQAIAVIFKAEKLTAAEHYAPAHIKHKAKLFKDLPAVIAVPYVQFIGKQLNSVLEKKVNDITSETAEGVE